MILKGGFKIFDSIENAQLYHPLSEKIKDAFDFIKSTDWKNLTPGKYVYNENIYGNLQEYETKRPQDAEFEVHRDYYDIQYVISGEEVMGFGSLDDFKVTKEYDKEKDVHSLHQKMLINRVSTWLVKQKKLRR